MVKSSRILSVSPWGLWSSDWAVLLVASRLLKDSQTFMLSYVTAALPSNLLLLLQRRTTFPAFHRPSSFDLSYFQIQSVLCYICTILNQILSWSEKQMITSCSCLCVLWTLHTRVRNNGTICWWSLKRNVIRVKILGCELGFSVVGLCHLLTESLITDFRSNGLQNHKMQIRAKMFNDHSNNKWRMNYNRPGSASKQMQRECTWHLFTKRPQTWHRISLGPQQDRMNNLILPFVML